MLLLTAFIFIISNIVFGSVVVWSIQVYRKLNTMESEMSPKTKRLQSHFNRMLTTQVRVICLSNAEKAISFFDILKWFC
jgi:predicted PurR-regulated permease PerM